jgi:uncharacterized membrane protein
VRHAGALAGWFFVIILFALMTVWAAREDTAAGAFMGTCLGLLIVVPLVVRSRD